MKKIMKHILALAIVFATLSSNATEAVTFTNKEDGKTLLMFENVSQGDQLLVKDAFGIILYKESIEKSGQYNKSFDLTSLPDGNYIFELDKKHQIRTYPFKVDLSVVTFNKAKLTVINKPVVSAKNNMVYVTSNNQNPTDYKIEIFYNTNGSYFEKIHTETVKDAINFGKKFKLLEDKKEDYKVVITYEGRTFTSIVNF
ncbi:MAG: hypothetical protein WBC43_05175 [Olleya sp.]|jgi:hypothetical protein|tara:strand:+ start:137109 stop:137705 length:597 start_codon:yes stop_codon:yes gene_type:complete